MENFFSPLYPINVYNAENLKFLKLFAKIRIPSFPLNGDIVFRMHTMYSLHGGDNLELGLGHFHKLKPNLSIYLSSLCVGGG